MHPQFFEASATFAIAALLAAYTLAQAPPSRARMLLLTMLGGMSLWTGCVALSRVVSDPSVALFMADLAFLGIFATPPVWFALAAQLTRREWFACGHAGRRNAAILVAPSLVMVLALATNWHHRWFLREPGLLLSSTPHEWAGPLFWAWAAWAYLLVCGGSLLYMQWSRRLVTDEARWRGLMVLVASGLPLVGNLIHLFGGSSESHDPTPLLLGTTVLILFIADWRYRLLGTVPVARRDVIEHLSDGVVVADGDGVILDMNPAAEAMVGASLAEMVGQPIVRAVAAQAEDRFEFDEVAFNRVVVDMCRAQSGFETRVENFAGQHFEIHGASVTDALGHATGLYLILRDVTEKARYDHVVREGRRAQAIASLAAGIAHEVNNPLAYVRANVSHLLEGLGRPKKSSPESDEDLEQVLIETLEGIDRIGGIVERIRQFTRTQDAVREQIEVGDVLHEVVRIRGLERREDLEVSVDVAAELPPVLGTRDGLLEAVLHLVENAEAALRESGHRIWLRAVRDGDGLRVEIEDDGPGIDPANRERIFEPFFSTRDAGDGAGLGLPLCAKHVADFGGSISIEPREAGGTRAELRLPAGVVAAGARAFTSEAG